MARITISFKNTEKDMKLYEYWDNLEDKSVEIKNVLRREMELREKSQDNSPKDISKKKEKVENILDF